MWKWLLGLAIAVAAGIAGGGLLLVRSGKVDRLIVALRPEEKVTEVRLERVTRGDLVRTVNAPGSVQPRTRVQVSAQVSARIIELPFREGQDVKKGDVVVRLDSDDYAASLESSKAALRGEEARLEGARAALKEAESALGRTRALVESKDASPSELDAAEAAYLRAASNVKASEFSLDVARANIVRAQKNLDFTTIRAPMDGTITKLNSEVGEQVLGTFNNAGSVIMEIADLSVMLLKARVDETNIAPVRPGQPARVTLNAYRDRVIRGVVERTRLHRELARDGTGYVEAEIRLEIAPGERLFSDGLGNADIEVETLRDVIRVPTQSVLDRRVDELPKATVESSPHVDRRKAFAWVVYTMTAEGKAEPIPVTVGVSDLSHTVVLGGLSEGDRIITGPYKTLVTLKHEQKIAEEGTLKKKGDAPGKTTPAEPAPTVSAGGPRTGKS